DVPRHEAVAYPLDAVVPPGALREQRALGGLDGVEPHGRVMLSQVSADAGEKAARALGIHESADPAVHLLPDLWTGREDVRLDVVGVVELPRHPVARRIGAADLTELFERE